MISGLDEHYTKSEILSTIEGISYPGGNTKIGAALTKSKLELFEKSARAGVSNIAIVITDGISQDNVGAPAKQLRNSGCTVFSVGIGNKYDKKQLQDIATDPDSQHVLDADFDALDSIIDKIVEIACKGGCSQFSVLAISGSKLLFSECNPPVFKKPRISGNNMASPFMQDLQFAGNGGRRGVRLHTSCLARRILVSPH